MTNRLNTLLGGAALLTAFIATSASAAVIVDPVSGGPFTIQNPLAGLPAVALLKANTYDFTFSMAQPLTNSTATIQIEAQAQKTGINENITFDLYQGTPDAGTKLATSSTGSNANLVFNPSVGPYYIEVTPSYIASNKEALSGTILINPVPEPAAWALMLVGFGGLGLALRRRAGKLAAV